MAGKRELLKMWPPFSFRIHEQASPFHHLAYLQGLSSKLSTGTHHPHAGSAGWVGPLVLMESPQGARHW